MHGGVIEDLANFPSALIFGAQTRRTNLTEASTELHQIWRGHVGQLLTFMSFAFFRAAWNASAD